MTIVPLFTTNRKNGQYLFDIKDMVHEPVIVEAGLEIKNILQAIAFQAINTDTLGLTDEAAHLYMPTIADTEYDDSFLDWQVVEGIPMIYNRPRLPLTSQFKGYFETNEQHSAFAMKGGGGALLNMSRARKGLKPLPVQETDVLWIDWLKSKGFDATIRRDENIAPKSLPVFQIPVYGHHLTAELMIIHRGDYARDLENIVLAKREKNPQQVITMVRRLKAERASGGGVSLDSILLPWVVTINGYQYQAALSFIDTIALHGQTTYAELTKATDCYKDAKELFTPEEKGQMLISGCERPGEMEEYGGNDLSAPAILQNNAYLFKQIYADLGVIESYEDPKLTIGATVFSLYEAVLEDKLRNAGLYGLSEEYPALLRGKKLNERGKLVERQMWTAFSKEFLSEASASTLRTHKDTRALLSKVFGGRCFNNRPNLILLKGTLADTDGASMYAESQRNQPVPVGKAVFLNRHEPGKSMKLQTLREFLRDYRKHLVKGTWHIIVRSKRPLKYAQDLIVSWFDKSKGVKCSDGSFTHTGDMLRKMIQAAQNAKADADVLTELDDFDEESGSVKILTHEIHYGVIQHDLLQIIEHVFSPQQRNDFYDSLEVVNGIYYDAEQEIKDKVYEDGSVEDSLSVKIEGLLSTIQEHKDEGQVTTHVKEKGKKYKSAITIDSSVSPWFQLNMGELFIDKLLANRKCHKKKTPLNKLFKLCVNTNYGVQTSKHFEEANVVIGNNITARSRAFIWLAEKGLNLAEVITDGGILDLNRVLYPSVVGEKICTSSLALLWNKRQLYNHGIKLAPLDDCKHIDLGWVEYQAFDDDEKEVVTKYATKLTLTRQDDSIEIISPTIEADASHPGCYKADEVAVKWLDEKLLEHLQKIFSDEIDVLHDKESRSLKVSVDENKKPILSYVDSEGQFVFETKMAMDKATFHGAGNYFIDGNPNEPEGVLKFRSQEMKRLHKTFECEPYNPVTHFFRELSQNPRNMKRGRAGVKQTQIKCGEFVRRAEYFRSQGLTIGDSYYKTVLITEFSLSQFPFRTREQLLKWTKENDEMKQEFGQSAEWFFLNDDGTLDYESMVDFISKAVIRGEPSMKQALDKHRNAHRKGDRKHPEFDKLMALKKQLKLPPPIFT